MGRLVEQRQEGVHRASLAQLQGFPPQRTFDGKDATLRFGPRKPDLFLRVVCRAGQLQLMLCDNAGALR